MINTFFQNLCDSNNRSRVHFIWIDINGTAYSTEVVVGVIEKHPIYFDIHDETKAVIIIDDAYVGYSTKYI